MIIIFVLTNFFTQLVTTFSGFYEKDFYILDEAEQREKLFIFIRNVLLVQVFKMVIDLIQQVFWEYKNKVTLNQIYSNLFSKMVNAPINEFYDVTPVESIMLRFTQSVECFQSSIITSILRIFSSVSSFMIKITIFASVSNWLSVVCIICTWKLVQGQATWRVIQKNFWMLENTIRKKLDVTTY